MRQFKSFVRWRDGVSGEQTLTDVLVAETGHTDYAWDQNDVAVVTATWKSELDEARTCKGVA